MGIYSTTGTVSHAHPIPAFLAVAFFGIALLIGVLHETTFALEVLRMLVVRVKEHLRKLWTAARELWRELTTWERSAESQRDQQSRSDEEGRCK